MDRHCLEQRGRIADLRGSCRESNRTAEPPFRLKMPARIGERQVSMNEAIARDAIDLAIALGILAAQRIIPQDRFDEFEFYGELGMNGELHPIPGALPAAIVPVTRSRSGVPALAPRTSDARAA